MAKFCGMCGKPIADGEICGDCAAKKSGAPAPESSLGEVPKAKKGKKKLLLAAIIIVLIAAVAVIAIVVGTGGDSESESSGETQSSSDFFGGASNSDSSDEDIVLNSSYDVPEIDADAYYSAHGTVVSSVSAYESLELLGEGDAYRAFSERELAANDVFAEYNVAGDMTPSMRISGYSSEKHPVYTAYYRTAGGDLWSVSQINGKFIANPLSYNAKNPSAPQVLFSESDTLETYDCVTNKFFTVRPAADAISLKTVARIDAQTLEALTEGAIATL